MAAYVTSLVQRRTYKFLGHLHDLANDFFYFKKKASKIGHPRILAQMPRIHTFEDSGQAWPSELCTEDGIGFEVSVRVH